MESAVCVSGFLLLLFSTGVHLSPHPKLEFGHEGGNVVFYPRFSSVDDYVLYRVCGDGDLLLLINCSQPERPQPDGYEVRCDNSYDFYIEMSKLTMSHSGDYRAEGWRGGNITEHTRYSLTVCAEGHVTLYLVESYDDHVEVCSLKSSLGHGSSLQLYRYDWSILKKILVLDTSSSLEPLVEDLNGRLQVAANNSLPTLSGVTERDSVFYCTVWRGAQCQSYSYVSVTIRPLYVFAHEKENVTLPCIIKGGLPDQVYWATNSGWLIINQTHPQEVMYMLNSSQTGDYSLIIPSVSVQHSGEYRCRWGNLLNITQLFVCTKDSVLDVMFSPGQSVHLNVTRQINIFWSVYGTQWYRQRALQPKVLIVDFQSFYFFKTPVSLPEGLRDRVTVSTSPSNSSLIISNLTAEDSGVYTWRIYADGRDEFGKDTSACNEGFFHLVYMDPLGVHSPFYRAYAPLIGCGLLGVVAAVIWFKLRSRRGEQTSGRRSREGQQSGDEDLYDDLEMAELNAPLSAVSDGAVEHSV